LLATVAVIVNGDWMVPELTTTVTIPDASVTADTGVMEAPPLKGGDSENVTV